MRLNILSQETRLNSHTPHRPHCEDRIGTGPPRARTEDIYVDLGSSKLISVQTLVFLAPLLGDLRFRV